MISFEKLLRNSQFKKTSVLCLFIISFEHFPRKTVTVYKKLLIELLAFNSKQWSAVHSYRTFIFKYLTKTWKKRTQIKTRTICCIIGFLKWKCVPASFPSILFLSQKSVSVLFIDTWFFQLLCFILFDQELFRKISKSIKSEAIGTSFFHS